MLPFLFYRKGAFSIMVCYPQRLTMILLFIVYSGVPVNLKTIQKIPNQLRFSHEHVGDLWQGDVMYGPYISIGREKDSDLSAYVY
jgi:hypothetical protein